MMMGSWEGFERSNGDRFCQLLLGGSVIADENLSIAKLILDSLTSKWKGGQLNLIYLAHVKLMFLATRDKREEEMPLLQTYMLEYLFAQLQD